MNELMYDIFYEELVWVRNEVFLIEKVKLEV